MADPNVEAIHTFHTSLERYFQTGDDTGLYDAFDPACTVSVPGMPPDIAGLAQVLPAFREALSDFVLTMGETVSSGDMVAYRLSFTAKHTGTFMGVPPTGNQVTVTETHIDRVRDGKIVSHSGDMDMLGLLQQIGAVPAG